MRNDVKQNLDSVKQTRVAQPRRALALATMFGLLAAGAGQLALAAEQTFASDLATASSKQRAIKDVDLDTGPWPLCSGETNTKALADGEQVLGLYPMGDGTYLVHTVDAIDSKTCVKSTTANLAFQFEGQALAMIEGANNDPPVEYDFSVQPAVIKAQVTEPVICHSYYSGTEKLALKLFDSNGDEQLLLGLDTVNYQLSSGALTPIFWQAASAYGPVARCHVFPYGATPTDPPAIPGVDADVLFAAGFEEGGDLEVTLLHADQLDGDGKPVPISLVAAVVDTDFTYKVRIRNLGEGLAQNIHVREFLPADGDLIQGLAVDAVGCDAIVVRADSSMPDEALGCAAANATGLLASFSGTLAPYDSIELTLTRRVPAGEVDEFALSAIAAFSDPQFSGDSNIDNNARPLLVQVINKISITHDVETDGDSSGNGGTLDATVSSGMCGDTSASPILCDPTPTPTLTFLAEAKPGYTFTGFKTTGSSCPGTLGAGNDHESGTFTTSGLTAACSVVATFHSMPQVSVNTTGQGSVTLDPVDGVVHYGQDVQLTVEPNPLGWELNGALTGDTCTPIENTDGTWTVAGLEEDCIVDVNFTEAVYRVDVVVSGAGSVFSPPESYLDVGYGEPADFTLLANDNLHRISLYEDNCGTGGQSVGVLDELSSLNGKKRYNYLVYPVVADCTVTVEFDFIQYNVTSSVDGHGRVHFSSTDQNLDSLIVTHGQVVGFWLTPDEGYHVDGNPVAEPFEACGGIAPEGNPEVTHGTVGPVEAEGCVVSAVFAINEYEAIVKLGAGEDGTNGTIGPVGGAQGSADVILPVNHGDTVGFEVWADAGRHALVSGCNFPSTSQDGQFTSGAIIADCEATVSFPLNTYQVTVQTDGNGSYALPPGSPSLAAVEHGTELGINPDPFIGYEFDLNGTNSDPNNTCGDLVQVTTHGYKVESPGIESSCMISLRFKPEQP